MLYSPHMKINIPLNVPGHAKAQYLKNFKLATNNTGRLMLFAGDQKIEHLNDDFYGEGIATDDQNPEHLFRIASQAKIGVFASQMGLIANYAADYRNVNYLIKLNSKTDLLPTDKKDPVNAVLSTVDQVVEFKKTSRLKITGVGYTLYPGSAFEDKMLAEAGQIIHQAHAHGLLVVLWIYLRGGAIKKPKDAHLLAGAAGLAAALGADFVKLNYPDAPSKDKVQEIIQAAGRTGVIFSGGESVEPKKFLKTLYDQIQSGARGNATGRNIHQKPLGEAVNMAYALSAITLFGENSDKAYQIYQGKEPLKKNIFGL